MLPLPTSPWRPAAYHGQNQRRDYFEGWYYKVVDASGLHSYAIIPGVLKAGADSYAFIQTLNGQTGDTHFYRYPLAAMHASWRELDLRIGPNRFTDHSLSLDIDDESARIHGMLRFEGNIPWPVRLFSPGVMGPYAFVPFMECYHGVVSLDHALSGELTFQGKPIEFSGGRGYIEKDWGRSFPEAWIWMQTNHWRGSRASLMVSIAIVPWLSGAFAGFVVGLWREGSLHGFATYHGARITRLDVTDQQVACHLLRENRLTGRCQSLHLVAQRSEGGLLHGPEPGSMRQRVPETLTAQVHARLIEGRGKRWHVLFDDVGTHAGLEAVGDMGRLKQFVQRQG